MSLLIWFIISMLTVLIAARLLIEPETSLESRRVALRNGVIGLVTIIIVFSPAWYEFPNYGVSQIVITNNDGEIIHKHFGAFQWENFAQVPTKNNGTYISTVITSRMGNRIITYDTLPSISNLKLYLRDVTRFKKVASPPRQYRVGICKKHPNETYTNICVLTSSAIFEFNNANSKEFAKYYNSEDAVQQKKFKTFVKEGLNKRLKKYGLTVEISDFHIM